MKRLLSILFAAAALWLSLSPDQARAAGYQSYPLAAGITAGYPSGLTGPSSDKLALLSELKSAEATPVGDWLDFAFPGQRIVTRVMISNGFHDSRAFREHARIKTLTLEFDGGAHVELTLPDSLRTKTFLIPHVKTAKIRLIPGEIFAGKKSRAPYLSYVQFFGYNPDEKQMVLSGEFKECAIDAAHSQDMYRCAYFQGQDGTRYGCRDDLCYHPAAQVGRQVRITGVVGQDGVLTVLGAKTLN